MDKKNSYLFFQSKTNKTIGKTYLKKTFPTLIGDVLFDLFLVNSLIKRHKIDIFHAPSTIMPLFKLRGVKYVVTVMDLSFLVYKNNHSKLFNTYYNYFNKRAVRKADLIITISENTKNDLIKYYGADAKKIRTIYLGADQKFFEAKKEKPIINGKYFLSITTHPKRKNIIGVLKAISISKKIQQYKYVIAGLIEEKQLKDLQQEIDRLSLKDHVILFGFASDKELISLYQNAEFFIFPSFYEGFGLPVVEAMAMGCPVITSDNSSLVEVVPDREWLVNPSDAKDIKNKMENLVSFAKEDRQDLIKKNSGFVKKFTWENTAREMMDVFEKIREEK